MSCFKIQVKEFTALGSTRGAGVKLRAFMIEQLKSYDTLELDLSDVPLTPSVADEAFGLLAKQLGKETFFKKVAFNNISAEQKSIMVHVISRRLAG